MDKPEHSDLSPRRGPSDSAFSLVEVTMALGLAAFAFVALFGLLPVGLNTFRQSMDTSVGTQIVQRVIIEAQQTDFDILVGSHTAPFLPSPTPRYFDEQGNELDSPEASAYQINTRITPGTVIPQAAGAESAPTATKNTNLATITVQIAGKPGAYTISRDSVTLLWNDLRVPISTSSAIVSRNK